MSPFTDDDLIELELLRDQEVDVLVDQGFLPAAEQWNPKMRSGLVFQHPELAVEIVTGHPYPAAPLKYQVKNQTLPRIIVDKLRSALYKISLDDGDTNNFESWANRGLLNNFGCFEFEMTALHIAAKTAEHLADYRNSQKATAALEESDKLNTGLSVAARYSAASNLQDNGTGLSTTQRNDRVSSLLGKTPEEICAGVPEHFRILHIESVVRGNLFKDFQRQRTKIRERLLNIPLSHLRKDALTNFPYALRERMNDKELLVDHLITPHLTFHGTRRDFVPSIVRNGFFLPGDTIPFSSETHQVRCGSTHGRGIYSSPSPAFALSYSGSGAIATKPNEYDGLKLIVCATVMGVSAILGHDENWRQQSEPVAGADSHVNSSRFEYIVFNRAQILPCYVIHLDWVRDDARFFENIPANSQTWVNRQGIQTLKKINRQYLGPGDIQRLQQAQMSKAAKWFPYGYGPATGRSFVVEGVGDVDEDEEDYGVYQKYRINEVKGGDGNGWMWKDLLDDGDTRKDEYYVSRRAHNKHPIGKNLNVG